MMHAQFFNPMVALTMPMGLGMADTIGMVPATIAPLIAIPAGLAFAFPIGTPANAIAYSSGFLRLRDIILPGAIMGVGIRGAQHHPGHRARGDDGGACARARRAQMGCNRRAFLTFPMAQVASREAKPLDAGVPADSWCVPHPTPQGEHPWRAERL